MEAQIQVLYHLEVDNTPVDYLLRHVKNPIKCTLDRQLVRKFEIWGRPDIDIFASAQSTHHPLWYGRIYHPEAITPDALLQPRTGLSMCFSLPPHY